MTLLVSSTSRPQSIAGALVNALKTEKKVELQSIGAGALNQSVKAVAIARGYVAPTGKDLICVPAFVDMFVENKETTGMKLIVECR